MLHLIPAPLHRLLYRIAHRLRTIWLRSVRRELQGCVVIALDAQDRVLLVRHSYGSGNWSLPGGGMRRGEVPLTAALRELHEELGCTLAGPRLLATLEETYFGSPHRAHVFTGIVQGEPEPDLREIVEARFFARGELPRPLSTVVARRLHLLEGWSQQR